MRVPLLLAASLLWLPLFGLAQPSPPKPAPSEGVFTESVDVRVVNVEVYVTDRSGQPVQGLRREDFEVYELKMEMRSGEQTLAVGVQDEIARTGSFLIKHLDPAARR